MDKEYNSLFDIPTWLVTLEYLEKFVTVFVGYFILRYFWGEYILLDSNALRGTGTISGEGLQQVWLLFVWAAATTVLLLVLSNEYTYVRNTAIALVRGWWLSLNAGVFEELIYRWMVFFGAMVLLPFGNFVTFGLVKLLYVKVLIPLADAVTLHMLEPQLFHPSGWIVGAALVSSSMAFRNAHKYLGLLGWINSWFLGMVFFYVVFNYGMFTAIAAHILYDGIIFTISAIGAGAQTAKYDR